jgi:tetratricopeptide (TPR) repeat protein
VAHNYTCFIVSPIGEDKSEERRNANDLLEYVIRPALRMCEFRDDQILRVDQLTTPGAVIGDEILTNLASADLCIVDLTGLNSNVMYECGIRQGNGKPFIILSPRDQKLPFDLAHRRAIIFDLGTLQSAHLAQVQLVKFTETLLAEGFVPSEGEGATITSISESLRRIEERIDQVARRADPPAAGAGASPSGQLSEILSTLSPDQAFIYAIRQQDIGLGEELLPLMKQRSSRDQYLARNVALLASRGSQTAAMTLMGNWDFIHQEMTAKQEYECLGSFVSYCNISDREAEFLGTVNRYIEGLVERLGPDGDPELRAGVLNQRNRIYYGAFQTSGETETEYLDTAIEALREALVLEPGAPSFHYNLAICLRTRGDLAEAVREISRCLESQEDGEDDADHLRLAYEIYRAAEDPRSADAITRLERVSPYMATLAKAKG